MNSHASVIASLRGFCAADPRCPNSALIADDDDAHVKRCAKHARSHIADLAPKPSPGASS